MATVAEIMVEQLMQWGVKYVYGVAGDAILHLVDAISRHEGIEFVQVRHEETAAFMASAHAKLTGQVGVCTATSGPGVMHLLNGLADAANDRTPVLAITGQVPSDKLGTDFKQYTDDQTVLRPLAEYTIRLGHQDAIAQLTTTALYKAIANGGVAHISVPKNLWSKSCQAKPWPPAPYLTTRAVSTAQVIEQGLQVIKKFRQPVILVGRGARGSGDEIIKLAEKLGAGIISTMPAKGIIRGTHSLYLGGLGDGGSEASSEIIHHADGIIIIGATWWPEKYVPKQVPVVQIDAYPPNIGSHTPVSFGIVGQVKTIIRGLLAQTEATPNKTWIQQIKERRDSWQKVVNLEVSLSGTPIAPQKTIYVLEENLKSDALICLDTGDHSLWFNRIFKGNEQEILVSGNWRSMGFGLPAAMAAKIAAPNRQVVAIVGDGGFTMSMGDFLTAVHLGLAISIIIFNNGTLALEMNKMVAEGLQPAGVELNNPDFAMFAKACGGQGIKVTKEEDLEPAIRQALSANTPVIIDIDTAATMIPTLPEKI